MMNGLMLNQKDPAVIAKAAGAIMGVSHKLAILSKENLKWVTEHPEEAIKLFIDAVDTRDKGAPSVAEVTFAEENKSVAG